MLASYNFQNKSSILTFFITFLLASSGKLARNSSSSRERPCLARGVSFSGAFSKSHRWLLIMQWNFGVTLNPIQSMLRACKICGEMQRDISSMAPDIAGKFSMFYCFIHIHEKIRGTCYCTLPRISGLNDLRWIGIREIRQSAIQWRLSPRIMLLLILIVAI